MANKTIKGILTLSLALLFACSALAQSTSKEINTIKRDSRYIYAESTMETEAEAREVAFELLMRQVEEYISSKRKLSEADNVLIKNVVSKGESMTMMRGTMHRVFVYVKKSDIEGVTNTTVLNAGSGATITVSDNTATVVSGSGVGDIPESEIAVELPEEQSQPQPVQTRTVMPTQQGQQVTSPLSGWKQEAVNSLLDCADINAVRARLNRLKAEYKVKNYGTPDRCPSVSKSFWAIFDKDSKLVTILGDGESSRVDYRTMTMSSLDAYKGMNAIWFNLAK